MSAQLDARAPAVQRGPSAAARWRLLRTPHLVWISAAVHLGGLLLAMALPAPAANAAVPPVVIELIEPAAPAPPPRVAPPPPTPAPAPPEAPAPQPSASPPPAATPPPKVTASKAPRRARAAPAPAGPAEAGSADPGQEGIRTLGGEFSGGEPAAAAAPAAPPAPAPPTAAAEAPQDACSEPLVKAKPLQVPTPAYPASAPDPSVAGKVRIQLKLSAEGTVLAAKVLEGLGEPFDSAALDAARAATFEPASRCGQPVASTFNLGIRFSP